MTTLVEYISAKINSEIYDHSSLTECKHRYPDPETDAYRCWLRKKTNDPITLLNCQKDISPWSQPTYRDYVDEADKWRYYVV
jgi:hypothetical protein